MPEQPYGCFAHLTPDSLTSVLILGAWQSRSQNPSPYCSALKTIHKLLKFALVNQGHRPSVLKPGKQWPLKIFSGCDQG